MMEICKICNGEVIPKYIIKDISYYYCEQCNFLFSLYWDESSSLDKQRQINEAMRQQLWHRTEFDEAKRRWHEFVKLANKRFNLTHLFWFSSKFYSLSKLIKNPFFGFTLPIEERKKLEDISPVLRKMRNINNILDFGCGYGEGVEGLREIGYNCIGVDPFSPTISPFVVRKSLHDAHFESNYFDVILSVETMEHIIGVLETFNEIYRVLKPGGGLFVQTMWLDCVKYQKAKDKWFYIQEPDVHVSIYSAKALMTIREKIGFHKLKLKSPRYAVFYK